MISVWRSPDACQTSLRAYPACGSRSDPAASINIRGLQDFGRVATLVDGAHQNFQRSGHFANGLFYVDREMLGGVDVVRGPVANIYGSGAIGGVASFRTKDLGDILLPGEIAAIQLPVCTAPTAINGSHPPSWDARCGATDSFAGGVFRGSQNYREGNGAVVLNTGSEIESGMVKLTVRPGTDQQIKLGAIIYNSDYDFGGTTDAGGTILGAGRSRMRLQLGNIRMRPAITPSSISRGTSTGTRRSPPRR
jgi:outer membrane receptor protein involved in Fe transport